MFERARHIPRRTRSAAASRYAAGIALLALIVAAADITAEAAWGLWLNAARVGGAAAGVFSSCVDFGNARRGSSAAGPSILALLGLPAALLAWSLGSVTVAFLAAFLLVSVLFGTLLSIAALALEEFSFRRHGSDREIARMLWYAGGREPRLSPAERGVAAAGDG